VPAAPAAAIARSAAATGDSLHAKGHLTGRIGTHDVSRPCCARSRRRVPATATAAVVDEVDENGVRHYSHYLQVRHADTGCPGKWCKLCLTPGQQQQRVNRDGGDQPAHVS
jgi:hypothetical protein